MNQKNIKERKVMEFDQFVKSYERATKPVKNDNNPHPGANQIKAERLFVRNDANPYKALGIPYDEAHADNFKRVTANQVDVYHGRKLTAQEKKTLDTAFGSQTVTHHQMAFVLDESLSEHVRFGTKRQALRALNEEVMQDRTVGGAPEELDSLSLDQVYYLVEFLESDITMLGADDMEYYVIETGIDRDRLSEIYQGYGYNSDKRASERVKYAYEIISGMKWKEIVRQHDLSITDEVDRRLAESEDADENSDEPKTDDDYRKMYAGKKAFLNGDGAKIKDEDGQAVVRSENNELRTSWSTIHSVMSKNSLFKTKPKKEEPKKEKDPKKEEQVVEFVVPIWSVDSLLSGDTSGLDADMQSIIEEFCYDTISDFGNTNFVLSEDEDVDLGICDKNDVEGRVSRACVKLLLVPSK